MMNDTFFIPPSSKSFNDNFAEYMRLCIEENNNQERNRPMRFEVGKTYVTRGGKRVVVTEINTLSKYPVIGNLTIDGRAARYSWTSDGRFNIGHTDSFDLVLEYAPDNSTPVTSKGSFESLLNLVEKDSNIWLALNMAIKERDGNITEKELEIFLKGLSK